MSERSTLSVWALIAALAIAGAAGSMPGGGSQVAANDKGKGAEKAQPKEVPSHCARLIKASERQRCLRKSGG